MIRRVGRKKYRVFAFDVESHNDDETIAKEETSIWLYSFIDETSKVSDESSYGYTIEDFLDRLEKMSCERYRGHEKPTCNLLIYVYNLSFEWSFILPKLLDRGFKWKEKIDKGDSYCFNSVTNKSCASVWSAHLKFKKNGGAVEFRDLSKIFPGGLANVAKSFGLPTQKGEIDYRINRLHDWVVTKQEKEYCFKDTKILMDILVEMDKKDDKAFWKNISSASYACESMIKSAWGRDWRPMKRFRERFPILGVDESQFLRKSVAGGITYAVGRYQYKHIDQKIYHYDLHQAHPSSAYYNFFPYGKGEYFEGKDDKKDHLYMRCYHVRISYWGVYIHSVISLIGMDLVTDLDLYIWDFEIPTMMKCYKGLEIEYIEGYRYRCSYLPWRKFYMKNYTARVEAKKKKDEFWVMMYKLLNNSSYGKLLEHGHEESLENYVTREGVPDSITHKREIPKGKSYEESFLNGKYTYLPVGSAIPAYTRVRLIESMLKVSPEGYDDKGIFHPLAEYAVYFDTDSIFFLDTPWTRKHLKDLDIGPDLGQWGKEPTIIRGQFTAPKRYKIVEIDQSGEPINTYHLAGINFSRAKELPTFDELDITLGKFRIQGVKRVKGGTIIVYKDRALKVQPKYQSIYESNSDLPIIMASPLSSHSSGLFMRLYLNAGSLAFDIPLEDYTTLRIGYNKDRWKQ